jgi:hypothetical protein
LIVNTIVAITPARSPSGIVWPLMLNLLLERMTKLLHPVRILQLAKEAGWHQRQGKIPAFEFLHSAVLGQASALHLTLNAQACSLADPATRQAMDDRYTPKAVTFFKAAFHETLVNTLEWKPDSTMAQLLHQHFTAIRLFDTTHCACADELAELFPACGGDGGEAGFKVLLSYEYASGQVHPLDVLPGKGSDQGLAETVCRHVGPKELGLLDAGFYKAKALRNVDARGGFFILPWPRGVSVWKIDKLGNRGDEIDIASALKASTDNCVEWSAVQLGKTQESRLGAVRLIAYRLSPERTGRRRAQLRQKCGTEGRQPTVAALELAGWLILLTNAPAKLLPAAAVGYLYRVRWQVELLFKQWKSVLRLDVMPSKNQSRVQCEVWARLLAALLVSVWHQHANAACLELHQRETSFSKVAKILQQQGQTLARVLFTERTQLESLLREIWTKILKLARKEHQLSRQTTWQNLRSHWLDLAPV